MAAAAAIKLRPRQQRLLDETLPRLRLARPRPPTRAPPSLPDARRSGWKSASAAASTAWPRSPPIRTSAISPPRYSRTGSARCCPGWCPEGAEATGPLPGNLRLWPQDARHLLRALPEGCLDRLFLLFPDPWPKARHAKRRFVIRSCCRWSPGCCGRARNGASPRTTRPTRPGCGRCWRGQHSSRGPAPATRRPDGWPPTRYEAKALREGRSPLYWSLTRL